MVPRAPVCRFSHGPPLPRSRSLAVVMLATMRSSSENAPALSAEIKSMESVFVSVLASAFAPALAPGSPSLADMPEAAARRASPTAKNEQTAREQPDRGAAPGNGTENGMKVGLATDREPRAG